MGRVVTLTCGRAFQTFSPAYQTLGWAFDFPLRLRHWASCVPICCISYICKISKSRYNNQDLKKKKRQRKRKRFKLNGNQISKLKADYLMICYEFRVFITCMKAFFYRPDFQKFLMCPLTKRIGQAFAFKTCDGAFETLIELFKHLGEHLKHSAELLGV